MRLATDMETSYYRFGGMMKSYIRRALGDAVVDRHLELKRAADPAMILNEMLRVGRHAIISFSNWGYWRCRLELLLTGRIPQAPDLPQRWYDVPRWQAFTITDFGRYCKRLDVKIDHQVYLSGDRIINVRRYKNLLSTTAVFGLSAAKER